MSKQLGTFVLQLFSVGVNLEGTSLYLKCWLGQNLSSINQRATSLVAKNRHVVGEKKRRQVTPLSTTY